MPGSRLGNRPTASTHGARLKSTRGRTERNLAKKAAFHGTILTSRQWEVMRYRAQGLTQAELARKLNTTRENISEIEHRAGAKIRAAKATLVALQNLDATGDLVIPSGTCVFDAVSTVIERANVLDIKLTNSADDILAIIRSKCRSKIRGHHLVASAKVEIHKDGTIALRTD